VNLAQRLAPKISRVKADYFSVFVACISFVVYVFRYL